MTKKQFQVYKLVIVAVLAITLGLAVNQNISFIPPVAILVAAVLVRFLYGRVKEVTTDERDYQLAGQAAGVTLTIISLTLAALGGGLLAYSTTDPLYYRPGYLILYIVCFIMVVNIISYLYYQKRGK